MITVKHQHSRRSFVIAGMGGMALAVSQPLLPVSTLAQTPEASPEAINTWESSLYGDIVSWDKSRLSFDEFSSGPRLGNFGEFDRVTLNTVPKGSVSIVSVSFQPFPFDSLEDVAVEFPENQWDGSVLTARHPRDAKLTDSAYGFFYTERDGANPKVHYCGYIEFAPPVGDSSAWSIFEVWTNVKPDWFDIDALSDSANALEINGRPAYQAWTFDEVMAAFAEEMEAIGA